MGYRRMTVEDLYHIFKRWHNNQSITHIACTEGRDRKTIRNYLSLFKQGGYFPCCSLPDKDAILRFLKTLISVTEKAAPVTGELLKHLDEIKSLINDPKEPVKGKTAYEIIKYKYQWEGSYETFKIFIRKHQIKSKHHKQNIIRIEMPAGKETQIDYGKVGLLQDHKTGRNRIVNAFCGVLSHSRLPYIEYCYSQKKSEFAESNVNMLEFYEGTTDFISLDNLKSGVIKPDLYDPKINKSYQDMADYYGVFIDPCRVGKPTDKGKIERLVPVARELFRRLKHIYPNADLAMLNKEARKWCKQEYGQKEHGTTGIAPMSLYSEEKKYLKKLPEKRFEIPVWREARVHPDQFFSFEKKRYSLPAKFKNKSVWVKKIKNMILIYYDYQLIRTYFIPKGYITYRKEDFPEVIREMLDGGYPKYLLEQAKLLGENAHKLVENILKPHAYINARRAQGAIEVLKKYKSYEMFDQICQKALDKCIKIPRTLKILFEEEEEQQKNVSSEPVSERGSQMIRDINYYWN